MSKNLMIESYNVYLLHACRNGYELGSKQVTVVVDLLKKGANVNTRDNLGNTPLHWVCHSLHSTNIVNEQTNKHNHRSHAGTLIIILLRNGANQFASNKSGWMPLHFAANVGNTVAVDLLLYNTSMTMSNRRKATQPIENFLTGACASISEAKLAILYFADHVRQRLYTTYFDSGTRRLHTFAVGMNEGIEGMVYNVASNNNTKVFATTPEWIHVGHGHYIYKSDDVTEDTYFIPNADNEMNFNTKNIMAVPIYSTKQMKKDSEKIGLNDTKDLIGIIMLMNKKPRTDPAGNIIDLDPSKVHFDQSNCKKIYDIVNGAGAFNVAIEMMSDIDTPLHYVLGSLFKELKTWTWDVHQYQNPFSEFVGKPMKEFGFVADAVYNKQRTLKSQLSLGDLETEEEEEKISFIEKAINAGINATVENLHSPIMRATMSGQKLMVLQLLNAGADPYAKSATGNTPLHVAASQGFHTVTQTLINAVCDPFEMNNAGFTPRDLCDAYLTVALQRLEKCNENLDIGRYPQYKSLRDVTRGDIKRITILESLVLEQNKNETREDEKMLSNSIYDFLACNRYMMTHRVLIAGEAIWLRIFNNGHINTWYDKKFASIHNIYYPIPQDLKHCPLRGKDEVAPDSLNIPVPRKPENVRHLIKTMIDNDYGTTYFCKITFEIHKESISHIHRFLVYLHPYGNVCQMVEAGDNCQGIFFLEKRDTNIEEMAASEFCNITYMLGVRLSEHVNMKSRKIFSQEASFVVVAENDYGQSLHSSSSQVDGINGINDCVSSYNTILAMHGHSANFRVGFENVYLKAMDTRKIKKTLDSYNILINSYCTAGNIKVAEKYYSEMKKNNILPNQYTYYSLMNFYRTNDKTKMDMCMKNMKNVGLNLKSVVEDRNAKVWVIDGYNNYGSQGILDRLRFEEAERERSLRLDMKIRSYWQDRDFTPPRNSDFRLVQRDNELSSKQLLSGDAYQCLNTSRQSYNLVKAANVEVDKLSYMYGSEGYAGSKVCRFVIDQNGAGPSKTLSNYRIQIPRGATAISFEFRSSVGDVRPVFKSRHGYIKISPKYVVKGSVYSTQLIKKVSIVSKNVVLAKSSSDFGNTIVTIFVDRFTFSMSGVIYRISIPSGSFMFGTPGTIDGNPRAPSKRIEREVIVGRGQALWDRKGTCPIEVRRLILSELQRAMLKQTHNASQQPIENKYELYRWQILWRQKTPLLVYPLNRNKRSTPHNGVSQSICICFPANVRRYENNQELLISCRDEVAGIKNDIKKAIYEGLCYRNTNFDIHNINVTTAKIVQDMNDENKIITEFHFDVQNGQTKQLLEILKSTEFKASVMKVIVATCEARSVQNVNVKVNFEQAIVSPLLNAWRSKTNIETDKKKQKLECGFCNHVMQQNYFERDIVNGIDCFHCTAACHVCGHISLGHDERKTVMRYLRRHREFPLPQIKHLKHISAASLFYGIISRDMILYRQYPKLLLTPAEIKKMVGDNEDDKASMIDSGTFDSYNFAYTRKSWNMMEKVYGWVYSWPEMLVSTTIKCFSGAYNGPFLMSEARKLKHQNFHLGILEEPEVDKSKDILEELNEIEQIGTTQKTSKKSKHTMNVLNFTKKIKKKTVKSKKTKKLKNEIELQTEVEKQINVVRTTKSHVNRNVTNSTEKSTLSSFFACFSTREPPLKLSKPNNKLTTKRIVIENADTSVKTQTIDGTTYNSDEDTAPLGNLNYEIEFRNSARLVSNHILGNVDKLGAADVVNENDEKH